MSSPSRYWSADRQHPNYIDGGLRKSTVAQYTALYNADVAGYRQTVLVAFQQTEDIQASLRLLTQQIEQQQETVASAQRCFDVATARYRTGLDPYLNVFTAQSTLLVNQQTVIILRVQHMTSSVQLIEALGVGWNVNQLPSEHEVAGKRQ
jgi:outer membrane protein TolC